MQKAIDSLGNEIDITQASRSIQYYCPICRQKVFQKKHGSNRKLIFSHFPASNKEGHIYNLCSDGWAYDPGDWRLEWMQRFSPQYRDRVIGRDGERHFADIQIGENIIEFQERPLSVEEFQERNEFFADCGYHVTWFFNLCNEIKNGNVEPDDAAGNKYYWKHPPKLFRQIDLAKERVKIMVQLDDKDSDWVRAIARVIHTQSFRVFYTGKWERYSIQEFVRTTIQKVKQPEETSQKPRPNKSGQEVAPAAGSAPSEAPQHPQKQQQDIDPELMRKRGGRTIMELWDTKYSGMQVLNIVTGEMFVINGKNGRMYRTSIGNTWLITGKALKATENGLVPASSQYHIVAKAGKPYWKLIHAFYRKESQNANEKP